MRILGSINHKKLHKTICDPARMRIFASPIPFQKATAKRSLRHSGRGRGGAEAERGRTATAFLPECQALGQLFYVKLSCSSLYKLLPGVLPPF